MQRTDITSHVHTDSLSPIIINQGGGEFLEAPGVQCQFKVTSGISHQRIGIYEITLQPHTIGAALHYHRFIDETFFVLKGCLTIGGIGKSQHATAGAVVHLPRFTPHSFSNESDEETKVLLIFNPAVHREEFFRGLFRVINGSASGSAAHRELFERYDSYSL